jgi:3-oxoacyl-[acyl-carrier protein] reductase
MERRFINASVLRMIGRTARRGKIGNGKTAGGNMSQEREPNSAMCRNAGVAVVTGGAGSIGRAILARFNREGFTTASWNRRAPAPLAAFQVTLDVTDAEALEQAAARTVAECGPIRALVVNAGIQGPVKRLWEIDPDEFRQVIEINLVSAFLTLRAVVPHMLANSGPDRGRIVLVSSVQGKEGTALAGGYGASKAGMIALGKTLGKELARDGILVNVVTPTVVRSSMETALSPERRQDLLARIPMGRILEPEEVAAMVSWLCGADCTASTGAVFDLSGGRTTY